MPSTWAPPAAFQDGMIGPHWSKEWIIEDCEVSNSKCCGISLGKAFEPEQPFENPDGTPIVFDTDYFGNNRSVAIPGPFARPAAEIKVL